MRKKANPRASNTRSGVCPWVGADPLMRKYHDEEWGVPLKEDQKIFEFLILESAQAGLSWKTILNKRDGYRQAFSNFDPAKVSRFGLLEKAKLLRNPGIVRNRLKIEAAINNAERFLEVEREFGTFSNYLWGFVRERPIDGKREKIKDIPSTTPLAETLADDFKRKGFRFLGSTTLYSLMQAIGLTNDHLKTCFRYLEIKKAARGKRML